MKSRHRVRERERERHQVMGNELIKTFKVYTFRSVPSPRTWALDLGGSWKRETRECGINVLIGGSHWERPESSFDCRYEKPKPIGFGGGRPNGAARVSGNLGFLRYQSDHDTGLKSRETPPHTRWTNELLPAPLTPPRKLFCLSIGFRLPFRVSIHQTARLAPPWSAPRYRFITVGAGGKKRNQYCPNLHPCRPLSPQFLCGLTSY